MITSVNNPIKDPLSDTQSDSQNIDSGILSYIKAAKEDYPSKEELFAEIKIQRAKNHKKATAIKSVAAAVLISVTTWIINPVISTDSYSTEFSQRMTLTLRDGSKLRLNSNSKVIAEMRLHSRELALEKGEASFTVDHGVRPFSVLVNGSTVLDIGTVFNVKQWNDYFITTVESGEVKVINGKQSINLISGQSIKVMENSLGAPFLADLDSVAAWQSGRIIFNGTSLKEAISNMQRYRKYPILLDENAEDLRISGSYDVNKIEVLLDSFPSLFNLKVSRHADGVIVIKK
ncbi:MAG: FecR family protein [Methylophilaceae bacterium]